MKQNLRAFISVVTLLVASVMAAPALAQKPGGVLRIHANDSPPSLSMHEESDAVPARAMMGVFNNLVMFDQHVKQNNPQSIVPDLATSWSWSEDGTQLTLPLSEGVKWHDGKPFTANDVKCTWDLLTGKSSARLDSIARRLVEDWLHGRIEVGAAADPAAEIFSDQPCRRRAGG